MGLAGPLSPGHSVWEQYSFPRERSALSLLLGPCFRSVWGRAPPAFHQTGGEEVTVKMPLTSFQDSFNRSPNPFLPLPPSPGES